MCKKHHSGVLFAVLLCYWDVMPPSGNVICLKTFCKQQTSWEVKRWQKDNCAVSCHEENTSSDQSLCWGFSIQERHSQTWRRARTFWLQLTVAAPSFTIPPYISWNNRKTMGAFREGKEQIERGNSGGKLVKEGKKVRKKTHSDICDVHNFYIDNYILQGGKYIY